MTVRVIVTLFCDAAREPGCHREYTAQDENVPATVAAAEREAQRAGWQKVRHGVLEADVCPACSVRPPA